MNLIMNDNRGDFMAKRGRPKVVSKAKDRVISVILNEKAFGIYRTQCKKRNYDKSWFHRYVSESLVDNFESKEQELINKIRILEKQRDKITDQLHNTVKSLRAFKYKKIDNIEQNCDI